MSEFELVQIVEAATAQMTVLIGQIIAINFAMMVAIYYFLNQAGRALKIAAFVLYSLGSFMFLLLAVRESNIAVAAGTSLRALGYDGLSAVPRAMADFNGSWQALALNVTINLSFWALWLGVVFLLFFWRKRPGS